MNTDAAPSSRNVYAAPSSLGLPLMEATRSVSYVKPRTGGAVLSGGSCKGAGYDPVQSARDRLTRPSTITACAGDAAASTSAAPASAARDSHRRQEIGFIGPRPLAADAAPPP